MPDPKNEASSDAFTDVLYWLASEPGRLALAGAAGGLVRWLTLRESLRDGAISLLVGCICALYIGPLAMPILDPIVSAIAPGDDARGFSSFIVGLGGISIAGLLLDIITARRKSLEGDDAKD